MWLAYGDGRKRENNCLKILHCWLLYNLTFDGKLCFRDDKIAAFV